MPYLAGSAVSCGVMQVYDFQTNNPMDTMREFLIALRMEMKTEQRRSLPCCTFVFSDIQGRCGDLFGQALPTLLPGTKVVWADGKNPNSGNNIRTYLWNPTLKELRSLPIWKECAPSKNRDYERDAWGRW